MKAILLHYRMPILFTIASIWFYWVFAYDLERSGFGLVLGYYGVLFYLFVALVNKLKTHFWLLAGLAFLFRFLIIGALPNLSQDFYRFIWDGRMLLEGHNPYLSTPLEYIDTKLYDVIHQSRELYDGMGFLNASHYTNYPPLNQACFALAGLLAGKSILGSAIVLRTLIILADFGTLWFGKKLLESFGMPAHRIFWYILNPFIILEMTGNLHFESVMLFFVVLALYLLHRGKWFWSAVVLACSVSVKLLPLLFLPLMFQKLGDLPPVQKLLKGDREPINTSWGLFKVLRYYIVVLIVTALTFLPFLNGDFISNFTATIALWFQNFEFNASVYYIIRWIGFQVKGWNIIADVGPVLPLIVMGFLLLVALFRKNRKTPALIVAMLFGVSFYFLLSTTVHPWYVATPLLLCVFTRYRFPVVWSAVAILSYSAYSNPDFQENLWLVGLEYTVVIGFATWEIVRSFFNRWDKKEMSAID